MKKNRMMRAASALLVAVLLTTCTISGTFAKYVTEGTGSDSARVAKFGVTVEVAGDSSFTNQYALSEDAGDYTGLAVKSFDDAKVVAPGTDSTEAGRSATFKITGTPEVATQVAIDMTVNHDIYLGSGTYGDPTTAATTDSFEVATDYYPVVFTLTDSDGNKIAEGNLATIEAAFDAKGAQYAPNVTLDETYTLTWAWAFESGNDAADTMLGNLAAGEVWNYTEVDNYDVNIDYEVTISVTQID